MNEFAVSVAGTADWFAITMAVSLIANLLFIAVRGSPNDDPKVKDEAIAMNLIIAIIGAILSWRM